MGYDHSLTACIKFKGGVTTDDLMIALQPLVKENGWGRDQVLRNSLWGDDTIEIKIEDGHVIDVLLNTSGEVRHSFGDVVQEFADGLECIAEADFIVLRDHDSGNLETAISKVWYGTPSEIEAARKSHACEEAVAILSAARIPDSVIDVVRKWAEAF